MIYCLVIPRGHRPMKFITKSRTGEVIIKYDWSMTREELLDNISWLVSFYFYSNDEPN